MTISSSVIRNVLDQLTRSRQDKRLKIDDFRLVLLSTRPVLLFADTPQHPAPTNLVIGVSSIFQASGQG